LLAMVAERPVTARIAVSCEAESPGNPRAVKRLVARRRVLVIIYV